MIRDDLSSRLVHLIRGDSIEEAVKKFESILEERMLRGGTGFIRGGYRCVCFTETPISKLGYVLSSPDLAEMRYRPFGIMLEKRYVFDLGGRPAIYQPDSDYEKLPEELRYRHVRFELDRQPKPVDLTWEREWRVRADEVVLPVESTTIIVPRREWRDAFVERHTSELMHAVAAYGTDAAQAIEPFPWHMIVLEDLGIPIPDGT